MLNYNEFKREFFDDLQNELAKEGINLESHRINKINGEQDGIIVRYPKENISPTLYYDEAYQDYRIMGQDVPDIARAYGDRVRVMRVSMLLAPEISFEGADKKLYATLINKERNNNLLSNSPHVNVGNTDLAIIARYRTGDNSSTLVNNELCGMLQMTGEEVMEIARRNVRENGYTIRSMSDTLGGIMADQGFPEDFINDMAPKPVGPEIYVLTNHNGYEGAVVGTDPDIMAEIRSQIGEDFHILPSSRHELLLVPESAGMDVSDLEQMVRDVNRAEVSEQDFLSDHVYHISPSMELAIAGQELMRDPFPVLDKIPGRSH